MGRGAAWESKGERGKALENYEQACLALIPITPTLIAFGAMPGLDSAEHDKAIEDYTQAIRFDPKLVAAYNGRGEAGKPRANMTRPLPTSMRLTARPNSAAAYNDLVWLQATCSDDKYRDRKKAIANAERGYELTTKKEYACIDTLAAAYAESGDFGKAP